MSRYTGAKTRLCRREGAHVFQKGSRCESGKCSLNKKQQAPGMHGNSRRRLSIFGTQLREKQKIKRTYGLFEKPFRNYFDSAVREEGITGEVMLQLLERRLDNVVYRLGLVTSRPAARKLITEGKVLVNSRVLSYPSYSTKIGDVVTADAKLSVDENHKTPLWLNLEKQAGKVSSFPTRDQIDADFKEQLVVEYYSR